MMGRDRPVTGTAAWAWPCWIWVFAAAISGCAPLGGTVAGRLAAGEEGRVWFRSESPVYFPGRAGPTPEQPVNLWGELRLPRTAGPAAAVVILPGCDGATGAELDAARALHEWGYAIFLVDSLGGRNIDSVCDRPSLLSGEQRVADAYSALRLLSTDPGIDASRIALLGFSHGGIATLAASTAWARDAFVPAGRPGFRAFVAFYPYCNSRYPEQQRLAAPLRIHAGALDDWTPAGPCAELTAMLQAAGQDAGIRVYEGARHSFANLRGVAARMPDAVNASDCHLSKPSILVAFPPGAFARCSHRGATVAPDPGAAAQARELLRDQLRGLLG